MSARGTTRASTYARRIERALATLRQRPAVLSPRDWSLISDWFERGIPLALVLDALEEAAGRSRGGFSALDRRGLSAVARAVEESWETIRAGLAPGVVSAGSLLTEGTVPPGIEAWRAVLRAARHEPLARLLAALVERSADDVDPAALDEALDAEIEEACEPERAARARQSASRRLAPYRGRMAPAVFAASHRRALVDLLRSELALPRLSLGEDTSRTEGAES